MGTTLNAGLRYPAATDAPDAPGAIYSLASDVDDAFKRFTDGTNTVQVVGAVQTNSSHQNQLLRYVSGLVDYSFGLILTAGTFTDLFQTVRLPVGFRPQTRVYVFGSGSTADGTVRKPAGGYIDPDGYLYADFYGATNLTRFDGGAPSFKAFS